jgi:hypothetical protein
MADYSPEKAGVGGSIPSLATTLIIRHLLPFSSPQNNRLKRRTASKLRPNRVQTENEALELALVLDVVSMGGFFRAMISSSSGRRRPTFFYIGHHAHHAYHLARRQK